MASILWLPVVFASCSGLLYWLSMSLPALPTEGLSVNSTALKFPSTLEELQALATLLEHYRINHMSYVLALYSTAYLFKQAFAIPGSIFLNLLGGALFGQWIGFLLTCLLSASGATFCFLLAKVCGRSYIVKYFPDKLNFINSKIEQNADSLFFFLMFLRLFPMTPNWFLNISSPICGVPIHLFFLSVFFGLMPYNFISVQTGCLLSQLTSMDKIFTPWTMLKLFAMATAALVPGLCIKKYQEHRSNKKRQQDAARENAAAAARAAEKVEVRSTKARKRLAFKARSKSSDEHRGGEVDPDFYNMLIDQHYAVRQKMQQVAEEKLSEASTGYCEGTLESQELITGKIPQESEMVKDNDLLEEEVVVSKETSIPDRTDTEDNDLTNRTSDHVQELLQFEPQGVEELNFSAKTEPNTDVEASVFDSSRTEHKELTNTQGECRIESKPNGQLFEDIGEDDSERITNGQVQETGKTVQEKTEEDDGHKNLIGSVQHKLNGADDKVELFEEDLQAELNHIEQNKDGQVKAVAAKHEDVSTEIDALDKEGARTVSAEEKLSSVVLEVLKAEGIETQEVVADIAQVKAQNDDISTESEHQEQEEVCRAACAEQDLPTVPCDGSEDKEIQSKEQFANRVAPTVQNDNTPTENGSHVEKVVPSEVVEGKALKTKDALADGTAAPGGDFISTEAGPEEEQTGPPAVQELPVPHVSEVKEDEETKIREVISDVTLSTQKEDTCTGTHKAEVSKPEDDADEGHTVPEDLSTLKNVSDAPEVELESKAEKLNGKICEEHLAQDESVGIDDVKSLSLKHDEHCSTQEQPGEGLPESAFKDNESATNGATSKDDQSDAHGEGAKSVSAKGNGEGLIEDRTEQSTSASVGEAVMSLSTADSKSQ